MFLCGNNRIYWHSAVNFHAICVWALKIHQKKLKIQFFVNIMDCFWAIYFSFFSLLVYFFQCIQLCIISISVPLCVWVCVCVHTHALQHSSGWLSTDLHLAWSWMIPTIQLFLCGSVPKLLLKGPNILLLPTSSSPAQQKHNVYVTG